YKGLKTKQKRTLTVRSGVRVPLGPVLLLSCFSAPTPRGATQVVTRGRANDCAGVQGSKGSNFAEASDGRGFSTRTTSQGCYHPLLSGQWVKVDFARLIWEDIIHKLNKKTREKIVPYPRFISLFLEYMMPEYDHEDLTINPTQVFRVHNWALKSNQPKGPPFTDHMKAIYNIDVPVESQAPTTSLKN
ncbi:hypothetical protein Tco_0478475, partial [Tanacetum coccineum]